MVPDIKLTDLLPKVNLPSEHALDLRASLWAAAKALVRSSNNSWNCLASCATEAAAAAAAATAGLEISNDGIILL